jgi:DNA-binding NtrC family response regulator
MQIRDLALLDMNILLTGETGTGKELAAYFIHELGPRRTKPYFELNCAGLDEKMAESALFGHVKGAFTGADSKKEALVAMADNGTLFLDELPSLCRSVQEKLLRFLESGEYLPVGSTVKQQANCRIIAGGQPGRIDERLNRDLYYRLAETSLNLPSLHAYDPIDRIIVARNRADFMQGKTRVERDEHRMATVRLINQQDINKFWREIDQNAALIHNYSWPGNVRELYAMIKQSLCLSRPLKELLEEVLQQEQKKNNPELVHDATPLPHNPELPQNAMPLPVKLDSPKNLIKTEELTVLYAQWIHDLNKQKWNIPVGELADRLGHGNPDTVASRLKKYDSVMQTIMERAQNPLDTYQKKTSKKSSAKTTTPAPS